jgi:hypothetical protein
MPRERIEKFNASEKEHELAGKSVFAGKQTFKNIFNYLMINKVCVG